MTSDSDSENGELVDKAGQSILRLLHKAGDSADQANRHDIEAAQNIGHQLQAARDRIAQLERDLAAHHDRAERAEAWLSKIPVEIEEQVPAGGQRR
jgi:hypothetical protein